MSRRQGIGSLTPDRLPGTLPRTVSWITPHPYPVLIWLISHANRGKLRVPILHSESREHRSWLLGFFEELFCKQDGCHCIRPTGVERQMSDGLDQLFLLDSVLDRFAEMESQLVRTIQSNQRRHSDKATITFR